MRKLRNWFGAGRAEPPRAPELPLDFLSPAFLADPASTWGWLRDNAPLAPVKSGGYVITRAEDIAAAFTDPRLGNAPSRFSMLAEKNRATYTAADVAANIPPFLDKPRHVEMRKPLSSAFFKAYEGSEDWIDDLAQTHLARLGGSVDLISDYGRPFATEAMARFVGLPHEPEAVARATGALFKMFAPITDRAGFAQVNAELDDTRAFIGAAVSARRAEPGQDLMSRLLAFGTLTDTEVADHALLVLADGIENIEAAIAQVALMCHRHPEAQGADPAALVLETLRMETPAQTIPRVVREAHSRDGVGLAEGTPLFLALGSANRDPARHANPDRFDPARDHSEVLLFGQGRHRCIGAPLGQLLVASAAKAMLRRGITVEDPDGIRFQPRIGHRWPVACRVTLA